MQTVLDASGTFFEIYSLGAAISFASWGVLLCGAIVLSKIQGTTTAWKISNSNLYKVGKCRDIKNGIQDLNAHNKPQWLTKDDVAMVVVYTVLSWIGFLVTLGVIFVLITRRQPADIRAALDRLEVDTNLSSEEVSELVKRITRNQ